MNGANQKKPALANFLGKKYVLVVEPSLNYRLSIKQFLLNLGVKNVKLVASVPEARRAMLMTKIGLFIAEWNLESTNGLQFCRDLRKEMQHKDVPFLLTSVENLKHDVILASEVRVDGYLLKPFSYEDFCLQIAQVIKGRAAPSPLTLILALGEDALMSGNSQQAEAAFTSALEMQANSARALVGLSRLSTMRGDSAKALDHLRKALVANPDYIEAYRAMLDIYIELNERQGILQTASSLAQLSPGNPSYPLTLAKTHLEMNNLEVAEDFFKKAVQLSPKLADAHKGLGRVYVARDDHEKATKHFKKALELDDRDISTLNSLGLSYIHMGQFQEGIDKLQFVIKLDPKNYRVLFNLGSAYDRIGEKEKAHRHYSQALVHCPDYDKAIRGLERLQMGGGGPKEPAPSKDLFDFSLSGFKND